MARTKRAHAALPPGRVMYTPAFRRWRASLPPELQTKLDGYAEVVHGEHRAHARPRVDTIKGSRMRNLKEMRLGPSLRVFFARDPRRNTVLLSGGDKAGVSEHRFYREHVKKSERGYAGHLDFIGAKEHSWQRQHHTTRQPARER